MVNCYRNLFDLIDSVSTRERMIEHLIDTGDAKPVYQKVQQLFPLLLTELKEQL
jgi:hypothetical protein